MLHFELEHGVVLGRPRTVYTGSRGTSTSQHRSGWALSSVCARLRRTRQWLTESMSTPSAGLPLPMGPSRERSATRSPSRSKAAKGRLEGSGGSGEGGSGEGGSGEGGSGEGGSGEGESIHYASDARTETVCQPDFEVA